jgi:hypothetical protein
LFGLNPSNISESIHLIRKFGKDLHLSDMSDDNIQHPIKCIKKIVIKADSVELMRSELKSIGIKTPFIYPEMDKVGAYLKSLFKLSTL